MPSFLNTVQLNNNELSTVELEQLSSDPASPTAGRMYYNTTYNLIRVYTGSEWVTSGFKKNGQAVGNSVVHYSSIPGFYANTVSTLALTANQVRYCGFLVEYPYTIDQMSVEVSTLIAASTIRMGIYRATDAWQASSLVIDAGTVDSSSVGVKSVSVNVTLNPGKYVTAINSSHAPTIRPMRGAGPMGYLNGMGANTIIAYTQATQTYGTFPDPGTAWTATPTGSNNGAHHFILLREA